VSKEKRKIKEQYTYVYDISYDVAFVVFDFEILALSSKVKVIIYKRIISTFYKLVPGRLESTCYTSARS